MAPASRSNSASKSTAKGGSGSAPAGARAGRKQVAIRSGASRKTAGARTASRGEPDKDRLLDFYKEMLLIRRFEEKAGQMYGMGLIGGFCHLYIGQEAVVVGIDRKSTRLNSSH